MTYIEFFDANAAKNVCACLSYIPDRVLYIGENTKVIRKHIEHYQKVFKARGHDIDFLPPKSFPKGKLDKAVELLCQIVEKYDDCVFDITGGDEILTLALGIVCERYPQKNIQIHRFNLLSNMIYDYDMDGQTIYKETPSLSVEENIRIYGGDIAYGAADEEKTFRWDMSEDFAGDLERMWSICKKNPRLWNAQISILAAAEVAGGSVEDGLTTKASRSEMERYLSQYKDRQIKVLSVIDSLIKEGMITCFDDRDPTTVTISYKNTQVKRCLTREGQALEMKIFATAAKVRDKDGMLVYGDALNGVLIDWDGELHDWEHGEHYDTENEIDVLLMHGVIPVFISCKNGFVAVDELYKLQTVAERFGGIYAKKVLFVSSSLESLGAAGQHVHQRAEDMGIRVEYDVQNADDDELERKIRSLWCNT